MTHLTRITRKGLFATSVAERPNRETGAEQPYGSPIAYSKPEAPFAVGVDMTPEQSCALRKANYPAYEWPSVSNLSPRTRGKHY